MLRFIQEVNTTTRSCALWDLEEDTEYIVHVQSISMSGTSPLSEPVLFRTPKESEKLASKSPGKPALTNYFVLFEVLQSTISEMETIHILQLQLYLAYTM